MWDANQCVEIGGTGVAGDPCTYFGMVTSTDDCGITSWCWEVDIEGKGTCAEFCTGTAEQPNCPPGYLCRISASGAINICEAPCEPMEQACLEERGCYWDGGSFVCAQATTNLEEGESCSFINDCKPGLYCTAEDTGEFQESCRIKFLRPLGQPEASA